MVKRVPIFVGVASLEHTSITVELRSGSSLYEAMDAIDEEIGEGGNDGLYPSIYRFLLKGKEEQVPVVDLSDTTVDQCLNDACNLSAVRYLRLEKTKSIWDERDTVALEKKVKAVKAKMEGKQTRKGKRSKTSTSQNIFDEVGKLGRCFKSFNDNFLNCEMLQTAASVLSCASMVGAAFAVPVPILEAVNASGKVRADIPQHLELVVKCYMANFGEEYDLSTKDDETYCSYMVLLEKHIRKLEEIDEQRKGSWKRIRRLWRASEHTTKLIKLNEELDATQLETAAMKSLDTNLIVKKVIEHTDKILITTKKTDVTADHTKDATDATLITTKKTDATVYCRSNNQGHYRKNCHRHQQQKRRTIQTFSMGVDSAGHRDASGQPEHQRHSISKPRLQENYEVERRGWWSPLANAVSEGHWNVVKFMLDCGDKDANVALKYAAERDKFALIKKLLQKPDADIRHVDEYGRTALE